MALENILTGSEETDMLSDVSQYNLDLSGIDNPLDSFSGLNLNSLENDDNLLNKFNTTDTPDQATSLETGPGPQESPKKKTLSMAEMEALHRKNVIKTQIYSKNLGAIAAQSRSPFEASKEYEFDVYKSNVERYEAYGKETFNELGFNPLIDNEKHYNENTGRWQEWKRMFGQFGALTSTAFNSNYRSIGRLLKGDDAGILSLDDEGEFGFAEANRLGGSSKGGFTGFATNLVLNSAYSVGIAANVIFEEAVIWGAGLLLAPETGGASLAASAAAQTAEGASIASKLTRLKKALSASLGTSDLANVAKGSVQMLKGLAKADDAKLFYQGFKQLGKGAVNFVNPFRQTTSTIKGIVRGEEAYRNLGNAAKLSRSFGSFYRDMRENWFTVSEAQMEGAGVKEERLNENIKLFQEANDGALPTGKDLDNAYANAYAAGRVDALGNIPLIFLTNRITFDGLFKFRGVGSLIEQYEKGALKGASKKFMFDAGSKTIVRKAEESFLKGTFTAAKNLPKTIVSGGLKKAVGGALWYTKANISEGIQELGQEWLSGTTKEYYKRLYTDPSVNQAKLLKSSIYDGLVDAVGSKESWESIKANIFSTQGLSTFASGFLMGGLIGGPKYSMTKLGTKIWTGMAEAYMKWNDPKAFEAYKKNKIELEEKHVSILNNLLSDPDNFFNKRYESFYNQKNNLLNIENASQDKNPKDFHDAKDSLTFEHVLDSLRAGTFDTVIDGYKELSKLSDKELGDYFNIQDGAKAREKINDLQERAEEIKKRHDYFEENYPNPFNPKNFKKGSQEQREEVIAYKAYEEAKKAAIFSQHSFDRALTRMNSIYDDLLNNPPLKKINQTDLAVILNPETIGSEIKLLRQEAALLNDSPDKSDKKLAKDKLKRAAILEQYNEEFEKAAKEKDYLRLSKIYKAYLKAIANERNDYLFDGSVDDSFQQILDYYNLNDDSKIYMSNVNYLTNPQNLIRHAQRIGNILNEMYEDRENLSRQGINNFFGVVELNGLIESLGNIGILIDPQELIELYRTGKLPKTFIDIKTGKELLSDDPRMINIQGMLDILTKLTSLKSRVEAIPTEEKTPEATPKKEPVVTEEGEEEESKEETPIAKDVNDKLEEAYNKFIDETGSSMTFDDFVATHPAAARIKAEATPKAPEVQPVVTPAASTPTAAAPVVTATPEEVAAADIEIEKQKVTPAEFKEIVRLAKFFLENPNEPGVVGDARSKYPNLYKAVFDIERRRQEELNAKDRQSGERKDSKDKTLEKELITAKRVLENKDLEGYLGSEQSAYDMELLGDNVFNGIVDNKLDINWIERNYTPYKDKINAEYDAKLKALEGTTTISNVEATKAGVEKRSSSVQEMIDIFNRVLENGEFQVGEGNVIIKLDSNGNFVGYKTEDTSGNTVIDKKRRPSTENDLLSVNEKRNNIVKQLEILNSPIIKKLDYLFNKLGPKGLEQFLEPFTFQQRGTLDKINNKAIAAYYLNSYDKLKTIEKEINAKYDVELAASEDKSGTTETLTARQQIAEEKINQVMSGVKSLREAPSMNLNDGSKASKELLNLISTGEITSDQAEAAAKQKYEELLNNLKLSDFMKGDVVTFKDGRKGIVVDVLKDSLNMKMFDGPGIIEKMDASKVMNNVASIKNTKQAIEDSQKEPQVNVSKEDEDNMKKSQEGTDNLATDSKRASDAINNGIDNANKDQAPGFDDLFIGCEDQ